MVSAIKPFDPMDLYNQAIKKIESKGIRTTKQRRVLAKILFDKGNRHVSAEELYQDVKKEDLQEFNDQCEECKKNDESVSQNLILTGFKICKSCRISKTIFPL